MSALSRIAISILLAATVTFALFILMKTLIGQEYKQDENNVRHKIADISLGDTDIDVHREEKLPEKPEEQDEPPPEVKPEELKDEALDPDAINIAPDYQVDLQLGKGPGLNASDGEYLPIVKVQPQYPRRAISRGIEGHCIVEYTVTKLGTVKDVVVIDCRSVFQKVSIEAALKFKYKPRVQDGEPVEVYGVRNKFTFQLAD